MFSVDEAAMLKRLRLPVSVWVFIRKVLLTLQLGLSPPELHNCWECNQFHL